MDLKEIFDDLKINQGRLTYATLYENPDFGKVMEEIHKERVQSECLDKNKKSERRKQKMDVYLARRQRIREKMGFRSKLGLFCGTFGSLAGAAAGVGVVSGVGAVVGGSGGFMIGQAIQGPVQKRQEMVDKRINVSLIEKKKNDKK